MTPDDVERAREVNEMNLTDVDAISSADLAAVLADSKIALVAVEPERPYSLGPRNFLYRDGVRLQFGGVMHMGSGNRVGGAGVP